MPNKTIQKQGEVFISQSEYDALKSAGTLQNNTKYYITKDPNNLTKPDANTLYIPKSTFAAPWQVIMSSDPKTELTVLDVRNNPSNHALAQFDSVGRLQASNPDGTYPSTDAERYVANVGWTEGRLGEVQTLIVPSYAYHIGINASGDTGGVVCFTLVLPDGASLPSNPTLEDICEAIYTNINHSSENSHYVAASGHIGGNMVYAITCPESTQMVLHMYNFTSGQNVAEYISNYGTLTISIAEVVL